MRNRYPGKCCSCRALVEAQAGEAIQDFSGPNGAARWVVLCSTCARNVDAEDEPTKIKSQTVVDLKGQPVDYVLLSGHPASAHQAAVFAALADPRSGSRIVKAVAGAGKTTVIKNGLRYVPAGTSVQGLAFNTDAAGNLKAALEEVRAVMGEAHVRGMRMGTFHSVCFGAVCRYLGKKADQLKPDSGKVRKQLKVALSEDDYRLYGTFVAKLVGLAKGEGIGALVPDTDERWYALVDHHALSLEAEEADEATAVALARAALVRSNEAARAGIIDYDDMLYLVVLWKLRLWQNDVVFVDEAQDTNPVRRAVARLCLRPGGRLFAVGDPHQSIYGFTGASADAMELIAQEFRATELPLTVSYRCARAVVAEAQRWVNYIQPADSAPAGEVRYDVPLAQALDALTARDAVLCRQIAPLVDLAYKLIASGRGVRILGKEIGEGLVNLVRAQKARGIDRLVEKLDAWADREASKFTAKGEETRAEAVYDKVACLLTIVRALPETDRTVPALERRIEELFDPSGKDDLLTLATVHKAKGQEWDAVAILRPDLMPSRAARQEWQYEQEVNLQYVAATRAKRTLLYLDSTEGS